MKYITNINTLSALLDRLITENIKLFFFEKENEKEKILHQNKIIREIKEMLATTFSDLYIRKDYNYIEEKRTYSIDDVLESLETLINSDILTGEGDRDNLNEINSKNPKLENFVHNHKKIRKANETRALSKNELDKKIKTIIDEN